MGVAPNAALAFLDAGRVSTCLETAWCGAGPASPLPRRRHGLRLPARGVAVSDQWDRSSPRNPEGGWPSEDFESRTPQRDPLAPFDPPPGVTGGAGPSRDWDDWPAITPPDDDYALDEPLRPSSDPWAESWSDEAAHDLPFGGPDAGGPAAPAVEDAAPAWADPAAAAEPPSIFATPEPSWSPAAEATPDPARPAEAAVPWTADDASAADATNGVDEIPPAQPAAAWSSPWSPDIAPDWMGEPVAEPMRPPAEADTEPLPPAWMPDATADAAADVASDPEPEPAPDPRFLAAPAVFAPPAPPTEPGLGPVPSEPDAELIDPASIEAGQSPPPEVEQPPQPPSIFPTPEPIADERVAEPPVEDHVAETALPAAEPEPADGVEVVSAAPEETDDARVAAEGVPDARSEPLEPPHEAPEAPWAWSPRPDSIQAGWEPRQQPPAESDLEPIWAAPEDAGAPEPERPFAAGEPTQVFPSSWAPPPPSRDALEPAAGVVRTSLATGAAPGDEAVAVDQPAIAEQAVPWLIGVILLLAGMVIVLLALIFAGDSSLGGRGASPSGSALVGLPGGSGEPASASATPRVARATPTIRATPTPVPLPEYGALELVYQGRSAALAPIYLLAHDFTVDADPVVLAQDPNLDVRRFTWSRDGTVGAALLADSLVSVEEGVEKRPLGEEISTATFGMDSSTVYAVSIVQEGGDDTAIVLALDFASAEATELARVTYARPQIAPENALQEAQFADDGGTVRLFWMDDDTLWLWVLGAGAWQLDPEAPELTEVDEALPVLWAPDRDRRIVATEDGATTTLEVIDGDDAEEILASTTVDMVVSHVRWSRDGQRVIFTGGRATSGGGVLQDLFLWDPYEGTDPAPLTNTGAAFGAEWRGTMPVWRPPE